MEKFQVNYCDKGNTSVLHNADTLEAAETVPELEYETAYYYCR